MRIFQKVGNCYGMFGIFNLFHSSEKEFLPTFLILALDIYKRGDVMRKKLLLLALVLLLSIASSAVKIEVWIVGWSNEHERTAENLIDREFTPITGIEVDILPLGWGDGDKVILAIISGDAPDIITSNVVELGIRGSLLDLKKTFGEEYDWLEAQLFPAITKQVHFEGTRFGLPQNVSVMNACYRTDILAEMGMEIPETWDDVRAMLPKLQANGRDAGFFYGSPSSNAIWGAYTLITQHGGNFFMPDGFTSAMDLPESIRGFVEYIELYTKHNMPKAGAGMTQFRTGEWVMFIEGYWTYSNLVASAPEIEGRWAPGLIPGTKRPDGTINHGTFTGGTNFGIPSTTKNYKEAWEFMKWFLSAEVQAKFVNELRARTPGALMVPSAPEALHNLDTLPEAIAMAIHDQINESVAVPYAPTQSVHYRYVEFAIQKCIQQGADPETEAKLAAQEMNREMETRKIEYKRFIDQLAKSSK